MKSLLTYLGLYSDGKIFAIIQKYKPALMSGFWLDLHYVPCRKAYR